MWMMLTKQWHDLLLGHYFVSTGYCSVSDLVEGSPMQCSDFPDYGALQEQPMLPLVCCSLYSLTCFCFLAMILSSNIFREREEA
eukprot:9630053-Ditylum_brightwellii.AAC.2